MTKISSSSSEKSLAASLAGQNHAETLHSSDDLALIKRRHASLGASILFYKDPAHIVRGKGIWLFDNKEKRYLDCYNNVASVGHCHPRVVEALTQQSATLNTHTRYLHENVVNYTEHLLSTFPEELNVVMMTCTGSEANDLAMQLARMVSGNNGAVVMENSYHGNTSLVSQLSTCLGSENKQPDHVASVEPPNSYRGSFRAEQRLSDRQLSQKYANLVDKEIQTLENNGHGVAAFLCDTIFDTQGSLAAPKDYFKQVYQKIRAAGGLCIADEVQAGFGRTGKMWGFEHFDVVPDIVTLGKPMGAGHPVAGLVTTRAIADEFAKRSFYFNTFGGNCVSALVADTVLSIIEQEKLAENCAQVSVYLREKLLLLQDKYPLIGNIRGLGMFIGIELVKDRQTLEPAQEEALTIAELMKSEGVLLGVTGRFGNVIKVRPPLIFSKENADELIEKLDQALREIT